MKIYFNEITEVTTELHFDQTEKWVLNAVTRVDEHFEEKAEIDHPGKKTKKDDRSIQLDLDINKVDEIAVVQGKIDTSVELICSRCATQFAMPVHSRFSALYSKDPVMAGHAHVDRGDKPAGQNKGYARHAHDDTSDGSENIEINYLSDDHIDLAAVVSEHLQLEVPFQPLCKEACKGMCQSCGADLNTGRCACSKISKQSPFAGLAGIKVIEKNKH